MRLQHMGNDTPRRKIISVFTDLRKWQQEAAALNTTYRVFIGSMMDIFEKPMPLIDHSKQQIAGNTGEIRDELFRNISENMYSNLMFLMLTKRPSNINKYIPDDWKLNPPANVMFGTSVSDQLTAETCIPQILKVNGKRFLSVEPQIANITLTPWLDEINWVIQGGESGASGKRRSFDLNWANNLRNECIAANTPYFFKQIDGKTPIPANLLLRQFP